MVCVHPRPFLKPNWLSPVLRVYWNLSKKQYSKILLKMGVMAIPLIRVHFLRKELNSKRNYAVLKSVFFAVKMSILCHQEYD